MSDPSSSSDRLIVASNRGPVSWRRDEQGSWQPKKGAGGLIVALGDAMQNRPGTWVSVALDDGDREMAAHHDGAAFEADTGQGTFTLRLVDVGKAYEAYYNEVANRLLWFTLHQLWAEPYEPEGLEWGPPFEDYLEVNGAVAEAVVREAAGDPSPEIHLQDYHLMAAAPHIRAALPDARILHYVHTPWVHPTYLRRLPDQVVASICEGLSACDVVAVSAEEWAEMVVATLTDLGGATQRGHDEHGNWLDTSQGPTLVAAFRLGIDADSLAAVAASESAQEERRRLRQEAGERTLIVRADRTDLSKNILRGLHAYDLLLTRRPDLVDKLHFRALLNPSRQGVREYRTYLQRCLEAAEEIRGRYGPEVLRVETSQNFPLVVAALQSYDVLLTNPVIDGTNLVAKEGPAVNEADGVLVLSRNAGAAEAMDAAIQVNPFDVEQTAAAMEQALDMSAEERASRAQALRATASDGSPQSWLQAQRDTLVVAVAARTGT